MVLRKLSRKLKIAHNLLRDEGTLAVGIRTLEFIQKKQRNKHSGNLSSSVKHSIHTRAIYDEILTADPTVSANANWEGIKTSGSLTFNWLMPPPGKGSGGHMTLYRFIKYLEDAGHTCRIYMHNPGPFSTVEAVKAIMGNAFPKVKAEMAWLKQDEDMKPADGIFATSWETAYTVYNSKVKAKKMYFVQDFEPYFYPVGSFSVLAENTYRLGLRGITAGGWLANKLSQDYGMTTNSFDFGSDSETYNYENSSRRKEIIFYARPTTERRAFELGILTLDLFHRNHPEYTINFIGWDVSEFNIPFPHKNLGILDPAELNKLYNNSAASLVMSLTNMSLLPLELISSGCIPVVNKGDNNTMVSNNPYIAYAETNPIALAQALSNIVNLKDLPRYSKEASESVKTLSWDESGRKLVKVIEKATRSKGEL
jgi:hypothetical protein